MQKEGISRVKITAIELATVAGIVKKKVPKDFRDPMKCISQKDACTSTCIEEWQGKDKDAPTGK